MGGGGSTERLSKQVGFQSSLESRKSSRCSEHAVEESSMQAVPGAERTSDQMSVLDR